MEDFDERGAMGSVPRSGDTDVQDWVGQEASSRQHLVPLGIEPSSRDPRGSLPFREGRSTYKDIVSTGKPVQVASD